MKGLLACLALVLLGCGEADKPKPKNQPKQGTPGAPGAVARPPAPVSPKDKLQAEVIEMLRKEEILTHEDIALMTSGNFHALGIHVENRKHALQLRQALQEVRLGEASIEGIFAKAESSESPLGRSVGASLFVMLLYSKSCMQ